MQSTVRLPSETLAESTSIWAAGVKIVDTTTQRTKTGNGRSTWSQLPYDSQDVLSDYQLRSEPVPVVFDSSGAPAGGLTDAELRASPVPVSGTVSVTAVATSTKQSDGSQKTQIVDGAGAVIGSTANALNVNISSGASSGTEYTEDAVAVANPVGGILNSRRRDSLASEVSNDGDVITLNSTSKGELYVKQTDAVPVTDNSGSLTVDNAGTFAVQAAQSGTWTVQPGNTANSTAWKVDGSAVTQPVSGTVTVTQGTGTNLHTVVDSGTVAISAGAAVIGHVIADSGSTTAVTGNVTVIQGTGSNLHAVLDAGSAVIGHVIADSGSTTAVTGNVAVTNAGLTNLDVALSTRTKPADQQHAIIDSGTVTTVSTVTSLSQFAGQPISLNTGTRDAGTLRVTVATNDVVPVTGTFFQSTQPVSIASGASSIAKAEDTASADLDVGVPMLAVRKILPDTLSTAEGDYEFLQMSGGRLFTSSTIDNTKQINEWNQLNNTMAAYQLIASTESSRAGAYGYELR